jgi:hypothetical protein
VAIGGSLGFLLALGSQGIDFGVALALLIGGVIAAPFAAYIVRHLAPRVLGVAAGGAIIITNARTILLSVGVNELPLLLALAGLAVTWAALLAYAVRKERAIRREDAAIAAAAQPGGEAAAA